MSIRSSSIRILQQLSDVLVRISDEDFVTPVNSLNKSTIGQHTRHTLEFFLCLQEGYNAGEVNYDERSHDRTIETNRILAIDLIARLTSWIENSPGNKAFLLKVAYDAKGHDIQTVESSFDRELIYNIEHAIHHMALIKVGLKEVCPMVIPDRSFGVAVSTIRYQEQYSQPSGR